MGETFLPKSYKVPCNLACAKIAKIGIVTAVSAKPRTTNHQSKPAFAPKLGGKIKFPAPKKSENSAKPAIQISFVLFIYLIFFTKRSIKLTRIYKTLTKMIKNFKEAK